MTTRTTKYKLKPISAERAYAIIKSPLITEKATTGSQEGKVSFRVCLSANKGEIKQAVEKLFGVKVTAVNTSITMGRAKFYRTAFGKRSDVKKAIVTLAEGQTLDVATA